MWLPHFSSRGFFYAHTPAEWKDCIVFCVFRNQKSSTFLQFDLKKKNKLLMQSSEWNTKRIQADPSVAGVTWPNSINLYLTHERNEPIMSPLLKRRIWSRMSPAIDVIVYDGAQHICTVSQFSNSVLSSISLLILRSSVFKWCYSSYWKFKARAFLLSFVFWKPTQWAHEWPLGSAKLTLENWTPEDGVSLTTKALASRRNVENATKEGKELGNRRPKLPWSCLRPILSS